MSPVLLHGSDQKVWQSLFLKSLQKKSSDQEKLNLTTQTNNMVLKVPSSSWLLLNATTSGWGGEVGQRMSDS